MFIQNQKKTFCLFFLKKKEVKASQAIVVFVSCGLLGHPLRVETMADGSTLELVGRPSAYRGGQNANLGLSGSFFLGGRGVGFQNVFLCQHVLLLLFFFHVLFSFLEGGYDISFQFFNKR